MKNETAVAALAALAQESRLAIFRLLVQAGMEGLSAGRIREALGVPPATLSFHLKELLHAGLIKNTQVGKFVIYRAQFEKMNELIAFLMEHCCEGHPEACGVAKVECKPTAAKRRRPATEPA
ncbi:metalloregulator ArsR/SmtB family transcription factor [Cupriavidus necator]|uniref:ArsR/SmtB family transcription factor n=1 Tax=Cupriavidus necator TaxID=106590 RepID=UPI00339D45D9